MSILERINKANDIKNIPDSELNDLAGEIRQYLLQITSENGGHLASNLGAVEITMAIHKHLDFPKDKLIFDVGHQSYTHKILTGRREALKSLRQYGGISGFPDPEESECDAFVAGHASNAVSVALGFASARELRKTDEKIVVVIGDGSLTGGMTNEALNNCAALNSNLTIILNDNERSIATNVGGLANYLGSIRTSKNYNSLKNSIQKGLEKLPLVGDYLVLGIHNTKESIKRLLIPGMLFEDLGLTYIGPIDGNSIEQVSYALKNAERFAGPVIIHALTTKGIGYKPAVDHPAQFHGVDPFDIETGQLKKQSKSASYTSIFSKKLLEISAVNEDVVAITAAMPFGTGLYDFKNSYPERFFDVGIAEAHAVAFAAGLAAAGKVPVVAIYSTFLQRAFDQIIHDVCLQNLHVVFAVDRAGIVGSDGKTHQGIFDESFLSIIPNMTVMSPKNAAELEDMLEYAINEMNSPVAVRYPRGTGFFALQEYRQPIRLNENEIIFEGRDICLLATGVMVGQAVEIIDKLKEKDLNPTLVNVRFLQEADSEMIRKLMNKHKLFVVVEESIYTGSYGERLAARIAREKLDVDILTISLPDQFIVHGTVSELRKECGLDCDSIVNKILDKVKATG